MPKLPEFPWQLIPLGLQGLKGLQGLSGFKGLQMLPIWRLLPKLLENDPEFDKEFELVGLDRITFWVVDWPLPAEIVIVIVQLLDPEVGGVPEITGPFTELTQLGSPVKEYLQSPVEMPWFVPDFAALVKVLRRDVRSEAEEKEDPEPVEVEQEPLEDERVGEQAKLMVLGTPGWMGMMLAIPEGRRFPARAKARSKTTVSSLGDINLFLQQLG